MLECPDLSKFGRSEQLHLAFIGVLEFQKFNGRLPHNTAEDVAQVLNFVKQQNESHKASEGLTVDEIDEKVVRDAARFATACLSPIAAFFGGIVAQEIVKFTGKYSPLK